MQRTKPELSRRAFLASLATLALSPFLGAGSATAATGPMLKRAIPATGEHRFFLGELGDLNDKLDASKAG